MCTPVITLTSQNSPGQQADPKSLRRYRRCLPQIYQGHIENIQITSKETLTSTKLLLLLSIWIVEIFCFHRSLSTLGPGRENGFFILQKGEIPILALL